MVIGIPMCLKWFPLVALNIMHKSGSLVVYWRYINSTKNEINKNAECREKINIFYGKKALHNCKAKDRKEKLPIKKGLSFGFTLVSNMLEFLCIFEQVKPKWALNLLY
jgi:hypothetical protein